MKRTVLFVLGALVVSSMAVAQPTEETFEQALAPAPRQLKEGATVIKWKPDHTYDTLKKGTNRLVCYDQSGLPSEQPFSAQCTSIANLDRVAQNRKFETDCRHGPRVRPQSMRPRKTARASSPSSARSGTR